MRKIQETTIFFCVLVITIQQKGQVSASVLPLKSLKFDFFHHISSRIYKPIVNQVKENKIRPKKLIAK